MLFWYEIFMWHLSAQIQGIGAIVSHVILFFVWDKAFIVSKLPNKMYMIVSEFDTRSAVFLLYVRVSQ